MKPKLVISCPASSRSGYGDHSRDLVRSLIAMNKFDVKILDQVWGGCPRNALTLDDKDIHSLFLTQQMTEQPDIWIQVTVPNEFSPVGKYNIGITAGIETTQASPQWIEGCNKMDLVIVPSQHSKYTLERSTYDKKNKETDEQIEKLQIKNSIEVLFEGLDLNYFNKTKEIPETIKETIDNIPEDFCFLYCGHWLDGAMGQDRKDTGMTISVFIETFKKMSKRNQPALILKASGAGFSTVEERKLLDKIEAIKDGFQEDNKTLPSIYLLHGDLEKDELNGLYNHSKVKAMISFTKGEGYGRPLAEFSITGKPVLASNWSGHLDFLSAHGVMIPGKLSKVDKSAVWKDVIMEESEWFTVDYGYASGLIKDVHKNYKKYNEKSRKQTQYMKDNFTLDIMTKEFESILNENLPAFDYEIPKLEELQTYE